MRFPLPEGLQSLKPILKRLFETLPDESLFTLNDRMLDHVVGNLVRFSEISIYRILSMWQFQLLDEEYIRKPSVKKKSAWVSLLN